VGKTFNAFQLLLADIRPFGLW